ncbi:SRPBCC family protein [Nocardioides sp.]|uniref:SRPBCC family protein n=1 Tax=Nocardioides sp. TaxID=35761 RepID=UPI0039E3D575
MTEQTASSIVVEAPPATVMSVIADFSSYPLWAKGVKVAEVLATVDATEGARAKRVRFNLDVPPIRDTYTLDYVWDGDRQVSWTLVEATLLRSMDGAYSLRDLGGGGLGGRTEVTYRLTLDLQIPLIGMLKRKGERVLIDTALRGLKTRVESL